MRSAPRGLDLAQAENALAHKALDESERDLKNATDFVSNGYTTAKRTGLAKVQSLQNKIADLAQQSVNLQKKIDDLNGDLATLPLTIAKDVADNVCHGLGTLLDPFTCAIVNRTEIIANPAIDDLKGKIKGANDALADIQNNQIKGANDALKQAESELSALDDKLQAVQKELERGVLQKSFELARAPSRA